MPVQVVPASVRPPIEVVLPDGVRVVAQADTPPATVAALVAALRAPWTLPPAVRIYLATGPTDLRRSIDGLSGLVRDRFGLDPLAGHLFLFRNSRGDRLKILAWDRSGFWVLYKRLEQRTFASHHLQHVAAERRHMDTIVGSSGRDWPACRHPQTLTPNPTQNVGDAQSSNGRLQSAPMCAQATIGGRSLVSWRRVST